MSQPTLPRQRFLAVGLVALVGAACASSHLAPLVDAGGTGTTAGTSGSTGGPTTASTGSGTGTSGGSTSGSGTTTGSGTTGGSGTTSGTTTAGASGPIPCVWDGDRCYPTCQYAPVGSPCVLEDGGLGTCHGRACVGTDLTSDPNNCGHFGLVCPPGIACVSGHCETTDCSQGVNCPTGHRCVDGRGCVISDCQLDQDDDYCLGAGFCCAGACTGATPDNCGACGIQCPPLTACNGGCVLAVDCQTSQTWSALHGSVCVLPSGEAGSCCGGRCGGPRSDPGICLPCGYACCIGSTCNANACVGSCADGDEGCPQGYHRIEKSNVCELSACGPDDDGISCARPDASYNSVGGECCGEACVDPLYDDANCGGCGVACAPGASCVLGACADVSCKSTNQTCLLDGGLHRCCGGQCTDLSADPENCGACGLGCPAGGHCNSFLCVDTAGNPASCTSDGDCTGGKICSGGSCLPPTCDGQNTICALDNDGGAGSCCGGSCSGVYSNAYSCLACGSSCPSGFSCIDDVCQRPDGGVLDCLAEPKACPPGDLCDVSLPQAHRCIAPTCPSGTEDLYCSFAPDRIDALGYGTCCGGACVDVSTDPHNCAYCGAVCPSGNRCFNSRCTPVLIAAGCLQTCGPGTICAQGECVDSICYYGTVQQYCLAQDGNAGVCYGELCIDPENDPMNCGAVGVVCATGTTCQNGLCNGDTTCGPGHQGSYCNLDAGFSFLCCPGQGCIDTSADSQNCGGCGVICDSSQSCTAGVCG